MGSRSYRQEMLGMKKTQLNVRVLEERRLEGSQGGLGAGGVVGSLEADRDNRFHIGVEPGDLARHVANSTNFHIMIEPDG